MESESKNDENDGLENPKANVDSKAEEMTNQSIFTTDETAKNEIHGAPKSSASIKSANECSNSEPDGTSGVSYKDLLGYVEAVYKSRARRHQAQMKLSPKFMPRILSIRNKHPSTDENLPKTHKASVVLPDPMVTKVKSEDPPTRHDPTGEFSEKTVKYDRDAMVETCKDPDSDENLTYPKEGNKTNSDTVLSAKQLLSSSGLKENVDPSYDPFEEFNGCDPHPNCKLTLEEVKRMADLLPSCMGIRLRVNYIRQIYKHGRDPDSWDWKKYEDVLPDYAFLLSQHVPITKNVPHPNCKVTKSKLLKMSQSLMYAKSRKCFVFLCFYHGLDPDETLKRISENPLVPWVACPEPWRAFESIPKPAELPRVKEGYYTPKGSPDSSGARPKPERKVTSPSEYVLQSKPTEDSTTSSKPDTKSAVNSPSSGTSASDSSHPTRVHVSDVNTPSCKSDVSLGSMVSEDENESSTKSKLADESGSPCSKSDPQLASKTDEKKSVSDSKDSRTVECKSRFKIVYSKEKLATNSPTSPTSCEPVDSHASSLLSRMVPRKTRLNTYSMPTKRPRPMESDSMNSYPDHTYYHHSDEWYSQRANFSQEQFQSNQYPMNGWYSSWNGYQGGTDVSPSQSGSYGGYFPWNSSAGVSGFQQNSWPNAQAWNYYVNSSGVNDVSWHSSSDIPMADVSESSGTWYSGLTALSEGSSTRRLSSRCLSLDSLGAVGTESHYTFRDNPDGIDLSGAIGSRQDRVVNCTNVAISPSKLTHSGSTMSRCTKVLGHDPNGPEPLLPSKARPTELQPPVPREAQSQVTSGPEPPMPSETSPLLPREQPPLPPGSPPPLPTDPPPSQPSPPPLPPDSPPMLRPPSPPPICLSLLPPPPPPPLPPPPPPPEPEDMDWSELEATELEDPKVAETLSPLSTQESQKLDKFDSEFTIPKLTITQQRIHKLPFPQLESLSQDRESANENNANDNQHPEESCVAYKDPVSFQKSASEKLPTTPQIDPTRRNIPVYIEPADYPYSRLSDEQMTLIENDILDTILDIDKHTAKPVFKDSFRRNGRYGVICADDFSRIWLYAYLGSHKPWPNSNLRIVSNESTRIRAIATLPICLNDGIDKILRFIDTQNDRLDVSKWEVVRRLEKDDSKTCLDLIIDEQSAEVLESSSSIIFKMGSGKIIVQKTTESGENYERTRKAEAIKPAEDDIYGDDYEEESYVELEKTTEFDSLEHDIYADFYGEGQTARSSLSAEPNLSDSRLKKGNTPRPSSRSSRSRERVGSPLRDRTARRYEEKEKRHWSPRLGGGLCSRDDPYIRKEGILEECHHEKRSSSRWSSRSPDGRRVKDTICEPDPPSCPDGVESNRDESPSERSQSKYLVRHSCRPRGPSPCKCQDGELNVRDPTQPRTPKCSFPRLLITSGSSHAEASPEKNVQKHNSKVPRVLSFQSQGIDDDAFLSPPEIDQWGYVTTRSLDDVKVTGRDLFGDLGHSGDHPSRSPPGWRAQDIVINEHNDEDRIYSDVDDSDRESTASSISFRLLGSLQDVTDCNLKSEDPVKNDCRESNHNYQHDVNPPPSNFHNEHNMEDTLKTEMDSVQSDQESKDPGRGIGDDTTENVEDSNPSDGESQGSNQDDMEISIEYRPGQPLQDVATDQFRKLIAAGYSCEKALQITQAFVSKHLNSVPEPEPPKPPSPKPPPKPSLQEVAAGKYSQLLAAGISADKALQFTQAFVQRQLGLLQPLADSSLHMNLDTDMRVLRDPHSFSNIQAGPSSAFHRQSFPPR